MVALRYRQLVVVALNGHFSWVDPEGGSRGPPPEKSQNIGFLSNTGPDPLENHKSINVGPLSARL